MNLSNVTCNRGLNFFWYDKSTIIQSVFLSTGISLDGGNEENRMKNWYDFVICKSGRWLAKKLNRCDTKSGKSTNLVVNHFYVCWIFLIQNHFMRVLQWTAIQFLYQCVLCCISWWKWQRKHVGSFSHIWTYLQLENLWLSTFICVLSFTEVKARIKWGLQRQTFICLSQPSDVHINEKDQTR